jgi:hypothetical protein
MTRTPRFAVAAWAFTILTMLTVALPAAAQQRVALLGFYGPSGGSARSGVRRVLEESVELVDVDEWQEAASALGLRGQSSSTIARVAEELGVSVVVSGGLRRVRRRWAVSLVVRSGSTGEVIGRRSATVPSPSRAGSAGASLARALLDTITESQGGGGAPPDEDAPPDDGGDDEGDGGDVDLDFSDIEEERPPDLGGRGDDSGGQADDEELPRGDDDRHHRRRRRRSASSGQAVDDELPGGGERRRRRGRRSRGDDDDDDEAPGDDEEDNPDDDFDAAFEEGDDDDDRGRRRRRSGGGRSPLGWGELALEVNGALRSFSVPINPLCDRNTRNEAVLKTGLYSEIGGRGSFYPGAISRDRWYSNLGLEFSFHHDLVLKIVTTSDGQQIDSRQMAITAGLVYRIAAGRRPVLIFPRAGWGRYSFEMSDVGNDIIPSFVYDHIYLGLNVHLPLYRHRLVLELGGHYLAVLTVGQRALWAYNARQQSPTAHGYSFGAAISGDIVAGLRWRIGLEMMGFSSGHVGKGQGLGSDPSESTFCNSDMTCFSEPTCTDSGGQPVVGGIETAGNASDIALRVLFQISYRFGWNPDHFSSGRSRDRDRDRDRDRGRDRDHDRDHDRDSDRDRDNDRDRDSDRDRPRP